MSLSRLQLARTLLLTLVTLCASTGCAAGVQVQHLNKAGVLQGDLPFSEAVRVGNILYLSGQLGVAPGSLALVPGGMPAEARQTMDNIQLVLQANGLDMAQVVKCTVMMADMSEWGAFNAIYREYFEPGRFPARSAFGANGLGLGARLEVECMAAFPDGR